MSEECLQNVEIKLRTQPEVATMTAGISMRPMLRQHRDVVIIERITRPLKRYDVLLYKVKGKDKLVLHRLLRINGDGKYVIRGDNTYVLEYVSHEDVVGVLKAFYRDGKYYDCKTSFSYHIYSVFICATYPLRVFWRSKLVPILSFIKHKILHL